MGQERVSAVEREQRAWTSAFAEFKATQSSADELAALNAKIEQARQQSL